MRIINEDDKMRIEKCWLKMRMASDKIPATVDFQQFKQPRSQGFSLFPPTFKGKALERDCSLVEYQSTEFSHHSTNAVVSSDGW